MNGDNDELTHGLSLAGAESFRRRPRIPLDNNAAERVLRGVVVGSEIHHGLRSRRGAEVAALFCTLFETAKLSQANPGAYVTWAATNAIPNPGAVTLSSHLT